MCLQQCNLASYEQESVSPTRGLPSRYSNKSYEWYLDYKQMTRRCTIPTGPRDGVRDDGSFRLGYGGGVQVIVDDWGDGIRGHRGMDLIRKVVDREMGLDLVESRAV